ncbi:hypothetical protein PIB30_075074, partial [Stylosanthes scabra]|nr:hypothetical protein [Stylosanthes scabra]
MVLEPQTQWSSLQVREPTKKRFHQESTKRGLGEQGSSHVCTREAHSGVLSTTFEPHLDVAQTWSSPSHKSSPQAPSNHVWSTPRRGPNV